MTRKFTSKDYDNRLSKIENVERVGEYINSYTPILHRCLTHQKIILALPSSVLLGAKLECCSKYSGRGKSKDYLSSSYDKKLDKVGNILRLEEYVSAKTPILHRCLIHNKDYKATPNSILSKGRPLKCCQLEKSAIKRNEIGYNEKLNKSNPTVKCLEKYKGYNTKIRHFCKIHNKEFSQKPKLVLSGKGIPCCSKTSLELESFKVSYDKNLSEKNPNLERIEDIVNKHKKVLHRCLIHNQNILITPYNALKGRGSSCCSAAFKIRERSKKGYDKKLKLLNPTVIRIDEYIDSNTKIKHRCLIHMEEHLCAPRQALNKSGLSCCKNLIYPIKDLMLEEKLQSTSLYIYKLKNYSNYLKIGVSANLGKRSNDTEYGELISEWHFDSKLEAFAMEQAILKDVILKRQCPPELEKNRWPGYTEVRKNLPEIAVKVVDFYQEEFLELGLYCFMLKYLNLSQEEKKMCESRACNCNE